MRTITAQSVFSYVYVIVQWVNIASMTKDIIIGLPGIYIHLKAKFHYASWFGAGSELVRC